MQYGRIRWLLLPAVIGVAGYFALFGGDYSVFDVRRARGELRDRSAELEALNLETDSLDARVDALENDPHAIEDVARSEYGMVKPGEVLYNVTGSDSLPADSLDAEGNPVVRNEAVPDR